MDTSKIIQSQYLAVLEMLKQVLVKCPAALWNAPGDKDKVWQKSGELYERLGTRENIELDWVGKQPA